MNQFLHLHKTSQFEIVAVQFSITHCHASEWYVPWSSQKFDVQCIRPMHAAGSKERSFEVGGLYK